ncbi:hypothetical protein [Nocardia sp. CC201C]|uniref:hypothetical protein n=1 Tax=Nocardia sp. CC201C TaxID=3044575 RepID=UPI0024A95B15|nr:hypothetical protein [Nocardia sp. CC201C]
MSAAWKGAAHAWTLDERIVHLADPLPPTRHLVALVLSEYSWRLIVGTMRDTHDANWLIGQILLGDRITVRVLDAIADALAEQIFGHPRWVVERIWAETLGMWREVDAELGQRGVDLLALAPDRATNTAYGVLHRRHSHKPETLRRWLADLEQKPARVLDSTAGDEAAAADWFAAAAMLNGGAPPIIAAPAGVDSELQIT